MAVSYHPHLLEVGHHSNDSRTDDWLCRLLRRNSAEQCQCSIEPNTPYTLSASSSTTIPSTSHTLRASSYLRVTRTAQTICVVQRARDHVSANEKTRKGDEVSSPVGCRRRASTVERPHNLPSPARQNNHASVHAIRQTVRNERRWSVMRTVVPPREPPNPRMLGTWTGCRARRLVVARQGNLLDIESTRIDMIISGSLALLLHEPPAMIWLALVEMWLRREGWSISSMQPFTRLSHSWTSSNDALAIFRACYVRRLRPMGSRRPV